jgi:uncharacterized protein (TIGR02147 family)
MVNVFEYQNYRKYLRDYYKEQKKKRRYFSYRYFSQKAGINASAFLYYVIENKRNLTKNSIAKIVQAIGFDAQEAAYFENLVFFNQAKTIQEKTLFYSKIVEIRNPIDIHAVDKDGYEFYSKWYISVIREIVPCINFKDDYKKLGEFLEPSITAKQAKEAIELLERLGFIERDEEGLYHQTNNLLSARPFGEQAFVIEKLQMEMLQKAMLSYDRIPRRDRMSASTTLSISREAFELFQVKTREFRQELLEMARVDENPDRVYQFTFNLFPLSRKLDEK